LHRLEIGLQAIQLWPYRTGLAVSVGGCTVATTPYRAPRANAVCERWIGSVRREALDWLEHYNLARPHRSLGLRAPLAGEEAGQPLGEVVCRSRLGGVPREYSRQAA